MRNFFFFSSRRRHTRWTGDWSSDVCSSDLVISASHNPYEDNGIKLFAADGFKLDDDTEHAIEAQLDVERDEPVRIGRVRRLHGALEDYLRELHVRFAEL